MTYSDTCPPCGKVFSGETARHSRPRSWNTPATLTTMTCHASMCWPTSTERTRTTLNTRNRRRQGAADVVSRNNLLTWGASLLNFGLAAAVWALPGQL